MDGADEFRALVTPVLRRFFGQHGQTLPAEAMANAFAARLWTLIEERGLPPPLAPGEIGAPGDMAGAEWAALVERVAGPDGPALLAEAARQLVKACFYPEFAVCRDSFRATAGDGSCRRQELARVRKRVSGTHCVDCPHWLALAPDEHVAFLRRHWRGDSAEFDAHRGVFLPEDFRALRAWLRSRARAAGP